MFKWIDESLANDSRMLLTYATIQTHDPYTPPKDLKRVDYGAQGVGYDYLETVRATDIVLGDLFNRLRERGLFENSLIVIQGRSATIFPLCPCTEMCYR